MTTEIGAASKLNAIDRQISLYAQKTIISVAIVAISLNLAGCEGDELPAGITKQAVKFDDVPESLRATAQKAVTEVKLDEAWKNLDRDGKLHSYEIRGKSPTNGKIREVRISTTGEILETE